MKLPMEEPDLTFGRLAHRGDVVRPCQFGREYDTEVFYSR